MRGDDEAKKHRSWKWEDLISHMVTRYPDYLDAFAALDAMAPAADRAAIRVLTGHELAAIEIAKREQRGDPHSVAPLDHYLRRQS